MRIVVFALIILSLCSFLSCSKNSEPPIGPVVEPENDRLKLVKTVFRQVYNGGISVDSLAYTYDGAGHLSTIMDLKRGMARRKFIYNGDSLMAVVDYIYGDTIKNPVKFLDGGNTVVLDYTLPNPNGGIDTSITTYKWSGDQLLERRSYLHPAFMPNATDLKFVFAYNVVGNVSERTLFHIDGSSQWFARNMEYDQKKNYFRSISRLEYMLGDWHISYASRSVNNLVKTEVPPYNVSDYIWTYNDDGYPLTMQVKGRNYNALELTYNK